MSGTLDRNISKLELLLKKEPANLNLINRLGKLHLLNDDLQSGEKLFLRALEVDNKSELTFYNLSITELTRENYEKALDYIAEAIKLEGKDEENHGVLSRILKKVSPEKAKQKVDELFLHYIKSPATALEISKTANLAIDYQPDLSKVRQETNFVFEELISDLDAGLANLSERWLREENMGSYRLADMARLKSEIRLFLGQTKEAAEVIEDFIKVNLASKREDINAYSLAVNQLMKVYLSDGNKKRAGEIAASVNKKILSLLKDKRYEGVFELLEGINTDFLLQDTNATETIAKLIQIPPKSISEKYTHQLRPLEKIAIATGNELIYERIVRGLEIKARERLRSGNLEDYLDLREHQIEKYIEINHSKKAKKLLIEAKKQLENVKRPSDDVIIGSIKILGLEEKLFPQADNSKRVKRMVESYSVRNENFRLSNILYHANQYFRDRGDYAGIEELIESIFDKTTRRIRKTEIHTEDETVVFANLLEAINRNPSSFIDKNYVMRLADTIREITSGRDSTKETTVSVKGLLGRIYAQFGDEKKARELIDELEIIKSKSPSEKPSSERFSYSFGTATRKEADLRITWINEELKDLSKVISAQETEMEELKRNIDFKSVRKYWVKDDTKQEFDALHKRQEELEGQIMHPQRKYEPSEQSRLLEENSNLFNKLKQMRENSRNEIIPDADFRNRIGTLTDIGRITAEQAENYIKLNKLNHAISNYFKIKELYDNFGIMFDDRSYLIKQRFKILEKILSKVQDSVKLAEMMKQNVLVDDYNIIKQIGSGAIKKAYLAENRYTGEEIVLLQISPNSKGFEYYRQIHPHLDERKIEQRIFEDEFSATKIINRVDDLTHIALMMQPLRGSTQGKEMFFIPTKKYEKTLEDALQDGEVDREKAIQYIHQICYALHNCHEAGIVHKDLKPDNIGITSKGNVLVSDFGCVSMFSEGSDSRYQYPLNLRPPELAFGEEHWKKQGIEWQSDLFTPEANAWTAGTIFYRMVTGKDLFPRPEKRAKIGTPEYHQQNERAYESIRAFNENQKAEVIKSVNRQHPNQLVNEILNQLLQINPADRKDSIIRVIYIIERERDYSVKRFPPERTIF